MRSEHKTTADEWDAFTKWRTVLFWQPGERKRLKRRSHQMDRRKAKREIKLERPTRCIWSR